MSGATLANALFVPPMKITVSRKKLSSLQSRHWGGHCRRPIDAASEHGIIRSLKRFCGLVQWSRWLSHESQGRVVNRDATLPSITLRVQRLSCLCVFTSARWFLYQVAAEQTQVIHMWAPRLPRADEKTTYVLSMCFDGSSFSHSAFISPMLRAELPPPPTQRTNPLLHTELAPVFVKQWKPLSMVLLSHKLDGESPGRSHRYIFLFKSLVVVQSFRPRKSFFACTYAGRRLAPTRWMQSLYIFVHFCSALCRHLCSIYLEELNTSLALLQHCPMLPANNNWILCSHRYGYR